ncbi:MAG: hypothetical protein LBP33_12325 [Candidatus Adiutrix sp.]|jgi:uroporphyrinogen-III decarboxylase|nr:hypothetical protein [Candidatus Adiutrix sp.]
MIESGRAPYGACGHQDGGGLDPQLAEELGLSFPGAHYEPGSLAAMAVSLMKKNRGSLALLPFCCTVEAEALGANINLGNAAIGPRPGDFVHHSLTEFMSSGREIDLESGRLAAILKACRMLAEDGHKVAVEISGPLSILSGLMELSLVVKAWRKDERLMRKAFEYLGGLIIKYALALKASGAVIVSYADPVAAPGIIGPGYSRALAEIFLSRFLGQLKDELQGTTIHLCPNTARLLTDCGLGRWRPISISPGLGYQNACLDLAGQAGFLGQACLKRRNYSPPGGLITELTLSDSAVA